MEHGKEVQSSSDKTSEQSTCEETCVLCDKIILPDALRTVKSRGIQKLIQSSIQRKDRKHLLLKNFNEINIHIYCQNSYIRQSNIDTAASKASASNAKRRQQIAQAKIFNYVENCFFCEEKIKKKDSVRQIKNHTTIEKIIHQLRENESDYYNGIEERVRSFQNLNDDYYKNNIVNYHVLCYTKFFRYKCTDSETNCLNSNMSAVMEYLVKYIFDNESECQFSLKDMLHKFESEITVANYIRPRLDRIIQQLQNHFNNEIVVHRAEETRDFFICYRDTLGKYLENAWYINREKDEIKERERVVQMASHIILQDIRSHMFQVDHYNSPSNFLKDVENIPNTLKILLDIIVKTHRQTEEKVALKLDKTVLTFAHLLASAARPRSFISSIKLGLSALIHRKYGVKDLITLLNNVGLCASYKETETFENSVVSDPENFNILTDAYLQFIFDNADHNTATIDGHHTFHSMGGIMTVTPSEAISSNKIIQKTKKHLSSEAIGKFGFIPLKECHMAQNSGLQNMTYANLIVNKEDETATVCNDVANTDVNISEQVNKVHKKAIENLKFTSKEILWLYGKIADNTTAGWFGFMENYYKLNDTFDVAKVIPLPFVNSPPNNYNTIFTVLAEAASRATAQNQKHVFVTFDQPLYWKARDIIASINDNSDPYNLKSVIVRLGGFHTLMSFLGCIGFIMEGSGLKEVISTVYAENSTEKLLTGHAYSRAVRAHILVYVALAKILMSKIEFSEIETKLFEATIKKVGTVASDKLINEDDWLDIRKKLYTKVADIEKNGPTSKLWVQYLRLVTIMLRFIDVEHCGDWKGHLDCLELMIPFFHAAGHNLYAKSTHVYLQDMHKIKSIMDPIEFHNYTTKGFFTIRRTDRFWSGIWSDMTIEQVLMRSMKCVGGLTHGRGITNSVIAKWISCTIAMLEVCNNIENFCGVSHSTSEQHVDARSSRISRDAADLNKMEEFFKQFDPFPVSEVITSIYSGVVGDSTINCFKAQEVGIGLQLALSNQKIGNFQFKKTSKVKSLRMITSTLKNTENEEIPVDPLLIFQRISLNILNPDDIKTFLQYELAPFPLSLFSESGLRKTTKSAFYGEFKPLEQPPISIKKINVVDGGYFLHRVMWTQNESIKDIVAQYVSMANKHYVKNSTIVFDGYPDNASFSTKSIERRRRKNTGKVVNIDLTNPNTKITILKKDFMTNDKNKQQLINILKPALENSGFLVKIAEEDADCLIVSTALENSIRNSGVDVYVIGQDIDLLVILTQYISFYNKAKLNSEIGNIFFVKESVDAQQRHYSEYYNYRSFKQEDLIDYVGFCHIFTGCDTTSAFYYQGKGKIFKALPLEELKKCIHPFYEKNIQPDILANHSFKIVSNMYSTLADKKQLKKIDQNEIKLHDLRYIQFHRFTLKSKCKLENLPPTEGALRQHAYRTYYQLQLWLKHFEQTIMSNSNERKLNPTHWGWKLLNGQLLVPRFSLEPMVPESLLKQITCSCKTGCKRMTCSCKKLGLYCSKLCVECVGENCENIEIGDNLELDIDFNIDNDNEYVENNYCDNQRDTIIAKKARLI